MSKLSGRILIVDDDKDVLFTAQLALKSKFKDIRTEADPKRILNVIESWHPDVIFLDMNFAKGATTGQEGLFWLREIISKFPESHVILNTAYGDIQLAVEAMKLGAIDFLVKPWEKEKLLATAINTYQLRKSRKEVNELREKQSELNRIIGSATPLIFASIAMEKVIQTANKVAKTDASVLILGANGTGKELIAKQIHQQSNRANQPFIKVDLGALAESLFESELFGHKKGAFTDAHTDKKGKFELADGGTIFLDEMANISPSQQAKLLSVIQNREIHPLGGEHSVQVDIRLICATNANLDLMVEKEEFRQDLQFRINTITINIPDLSERKEDVEPIANHYLQLYSKKYNKPNIEFSSSAHGMMKDYPWPGNVRELQHTIERAIILTDQLIIEAEDLALKEVSTDTYESPVHKSDWEIKAIKKAVTEHQGNLSKAAASLGMGRTTLYRKIKKYQLAL
ncbi:MAG: sigma-54 dependent transcriptional regulator [Reichenbachiella sp.]|uniref:sigma-54-dependent transcriptional regulator n=1 Tax=Reichenbachiella sp. TaxID=2184521 RepID=UPI0032641408